MNRLAYSLMAALAIGLLGVAAYLWLQERGTPASAPAPLAEPATVASAPALQPPSSAIRHPVEAPASAEAAAPLTIEQALVDLFGRKAVLSLFQLDDFPRRLAATVDNLARPHAPPRMWPLNPADGRFTVLAENGRTVISPDNSLRYTPYVLLVETVNLRQVVSTYRALYPLIQTAYEELGYPKGYFNDRLVDVIDHLLQTPEPSGPVEVHLPDIHGPLQPERPWVLYEFSDPAFESLSAGQKILLRMGAVNQRRIKGKLEEVRRLVTAAPTVK